MIFDFEDARDIETWGAVNDGVMGGVSDGSVRMTDRGSLQFSGSVSLENNGGFASIRSRRADLDLSSFDGLLVRVRGDGKRYDFNLRTNVRIMAGSYRVKFDTIANTWLEVYLPFEDFVPTSFGRVRTDLPALDSSKIRSFGLLISDKQVGAFEIEVDWIKAIASPKQADTQSSAMLQPTGESTVRDWIDAAIACGAPLYNAGEPRACAAVYERTMRVLLRLAPGELSPQATARFTAALREAEESADASERAWVLRRAMDFALQSQSEPAFESTQASVGHAN